MDSSQNGDSGTVAAARYFAHVQHPPIERVFHCVCGYPIFFRNHQCLHCGRALGYEPQAATLRALEPEAGQDGALHMVGEPACDTLYVRCGNFGTAARCNWLLPLAEGGAHTLCRCCRLNRMVPDLSREANASLWHRVEIAKRRLVSSLISMDLPVASRISEDPQRGLAFDLLAGAAPSLPVMTGHNAGIITLNVNEADDATREAVRSAMHEPYRTVLGHLRHESGHYYWTRLVEGSVWHEPFRGLFGDERQDYAAALEKHHIHGANPDWRNRFVSAYASAHPWEDWAETWAHYLHMCDALGTALSWGMERTRRALLMDPFEADVLYRPDPAQESVDVDFLAFVNSWVELTHVLNELSRSMGLQDFYPFVLSKVAVTKLHFVHSFIRDGQRPVTPLA